MSYFSPWRRIGRGEFGLWLVVVTFPGMVWSLFGGVAGAAAWVGPLMALGEGLRAAQSGDLGTLMARLGEAGQAGAPARAAFDWGGLVNNGLMLLMVPLCRMRLLDMGKSLRVAWVWAILLNVAAVGGLLKVFGLPGLPLGWVFGLLSFGGYIWLCVAGSVPKSSFHNLPAP